MEQVCVWRFEDFVLLALLGLFGVVLAVAWLVDAARRLKAWLRARFDSAK